MKCSACECTEVWSERWIQVGMVALNEAAACHMRETQDYVSVCGDIAAAGNQLHRALISQKDIKIRTHI
eukprot:1784321-Amphidinium_carterae.1